MDGQQSKEEIALTRLMYIQQLLNRNFFPVNLSKDLSINLANVTHFAPVETLDKNEKPTGKFAPGVFMISGEILLLTDEQKKNFSEAWNIYTMANAEITANLNAQYPTAPQPKQLQENNNV